MPRLLLVEFAAVDRFHRAIAFPFLRGSLREQGVETRWVRFGLDARARASRQQTGTDLPAADLRSLLHEVDRFGPSHLLFGQEPSSDLVAALAAHAPSLRVAFIDDSSSLPPTAASEPGLARMHADLAAIGAYLGMGRLDAVNLFDQVVPDFGWEAGNPAAASAPSLPFLLCGEECNYRRGLTGNAFFDGVDLSGCDKPQGCTFCVRPSERGAWRNDAVTLFRRQLDALVATHRPWTEPLAVRAVGEPILTNLEGVADALTARQVPPVHLLIDGRADAIVRFRDKLGSAVRRLSATHHALQFSLVGIESFSEQDLIRYNKGTTWKQNLDAAYILLALEDAHPGHFGFTRWGGLSLVLYSPWSRLEELSLNLAIVRRARLLPLCGKVFTSRLRMYEALPLHAAARRDGLLVERYDDPVLDTARRNFYADEVPWRFLHPGLEAVSRILLRLGSSDRDSCDPLWSAVDAAKQQWPSEDDRLALAERLVDAAILDPTDDAAALLQRVIADESEHAADPAEASRETGARTEAAPDAGVSSTLLLAYELGIKPVVRLENPTQELVSVELPALQPPPVLARRTRHLGTDIAEELFVGHTEEQVRTAIDLTNRMEAARDDEQWKQAASKVGVLLGYPSCCAQAFAAHDPSLRENYVWLYLRARLESPGEVSPLLNPGVEQIVNYVPCSLGCEPTLRNAELLRDAIGERMGPRVWEQLDRRSRRPWLLFVDQQGAAVELETDGEPTGVIRYRPGAVRGSAPLSKRVAEGDELRVDEQQILVLRKGALHASLGGRAFVWWYRSAVQAEFWSRMLRLRFAPRRTADGAGAEDGPPPGVAARELSRFLRLITRMGTARAVSFHGFVLASAEPQREDRCRVVLAQGDRRVRLMLAPHRPGDPAYVTAGPLGIHHPRDERIDTVDKDQAVRLFARYVQAAILERARRGPRSREAR